MPMTFTQRMAQREQMAARSAELRRHAAMYDSDPQEGTVHDGATMTRGLALAPRDFKDLSVEIKNGRFRGEVPLASNYRQVRNEIITEQFGVGRCTGRRRRARYL